MPAMVTRVRGARPVASWMYAWTVYPAPPPHLGAHEAVNREGGRTRQDNEEPDFGRLRTPCHLLFGGTLAWSGPATKRLPDGRHGSS
jgi:hypothetical protein